MLQENLGLFAGNGRTSIFFRFGTNRGRFG